jgi:hypothetical protein
MKEYNCPDCERTDSCTGCPRVIQRGVATQTFTDYGKKIYKNMNDLTAVPDTCRNCSQHPINGGSGICFCTLGSVTIN